MPCMGIKAECTKRLKSKGTCYKKKLLNAKYDTRKDLFRQTAHANFNS